MINPAALLHQVLGGGNQMVPGDHGAQVPEFGAFAGVLALSQGGEMPGGSRKAIVQPAPLSDMPLAAKAQSLPDSGKMLPVAMPAEKSPVAVLTRLPVAPELRAAQGSKSAGAAKIGAAAKEIPALEAGRPDDLSKPTDPPVTADFIEAVIASINLPAPVSLQEPALLQSPALEIPEQPQKNAATRPVPLPFVPVTLLPSTAAPAVLALPLVTMPKDALFLPQLALQPERPAETEPQVAGAAIAVLRPAAPVMTQANIRPDAVLVRSKPAALAGSEPARSSVATQPPAAEPMPLAPISLPSTASGLPGPATTSGTTLPEKPMDFAQLVDRLVAARDAAAPEQLRVSLPHAEFGKVSLKFAQDAAGLSVAMSSADPDFAHAVAAAAPIQSQASTSEPSGSSPRQQDSSSAQSNTQGHNAQGHNAQGHNAQGHNAQGHNTQGQASNQQDQPPHRSSANDPRSTAPQSDAARPSSHDNLEAPAPRRRSIFA